MIPFAQNWNSKHIYVTVKKNQSGCAFMVVVITLVDLCYILIQWRSYTYKVLQWTPVGLNAHFWRKKHACSSMNIFSNERGL